jgi:hypothetical protein
MVTIKTNKRATVYIESSRWDLYQNDVKESLALMFNVRVVATDGYNVMELDAVDYNYNSIVNKVCESNDVETSQVSIKFRTIFN